MDPDAETHLNNAVTKEFAAAGYTDDYIRTILDKQNQLKNNETESDIWTRVHRRHVLPETLMAYQIPWEWDEYDPNYIMIRQMICESSMTQLYEHTKRLRELKQSEMQNTLRGRCFDRRGNRKRDADRKKWTF